MESKKWIANFIPAHPRLRTVLNVFREDSADKAQIEQCAEVFSHVIDRNPSLAGQFSRGTAICTHCLQDRQISARLSELVLDQKSRFLGKKGAPRKDALVDILENRVAVIP